MTRADLVAFLAAWYDGPLADAGLAATDTAGDLKEPIDAALRGLGVAEADLATAEPTDATGARLLAEYHALRRVVIRLSRRFNLATGGNSFSLQQKFANAQSLLAGAEAAVRRAFGTIPDGTPVATGGVVAVGTPYLAPPGYVDTIA